MLAATSDPDGRRVVLMEGRWLHIKSEHPELVRHLRDIMATVREPDRRIGGRSAGEEWFLAEHVGPSRWLQVVVHYEGGDGWIATAFPRKSLPR